MKSGSENSADDGDGCYDFPAKAPVAAAHSNQPIHKRRGEEAGNAGTAQHESRGPAAVALEPAGNGRRAGNDVAEADADSIDRAETEQEVPGFRREKRQEERAETDQRGPDQVRGANSALQDRDRHERRREADEEVEQGEPEAQRAAAHRNLAQHVAIDHSAAIHRQAEIQKIERGKHGDQLPAIESRLLGHCKPPARNGRRAAARCYRAIGRRRVAGPTAQIGGYRRQTCQHSSLIPSLCKMNIEWAAT